MSLLLCCVSQADQDWSIEDLIQAAESTHYANLAVADVEAAFLEGEPLSQRPGSAQNSLWMLSSIGPATASTCPLDASTPCISIMHFDSWICSQVVVYLCMLNCLQFSLCIMGLNPVLLAC